MPDRQTRSAEVLHELLDLRTGEATEDHNLIASFCATAVMQTGEKSDQFVILESIIYGVIGHHYPDPREAGEILDAMTARVIEERMEKPHG